MKYLIIFLLTISINLLGAEEFWKNKHGYMSTRTIATAGAQSASTLKNDAAYLNPAASYSTSGRYVFGVDGFYASEQVPNQFMISVVDSKTNRGTQTGWSGGAFLKFYSFEDDNKDSYSSLEVGNSMAIHLFSGAILGAGIKYVKFKKNDSNYINTVTFDVGLIYMLSPYIHLSVVGRNLTAINKYELPLTLVSAIRMSDNEMFSFEFDFTSDFSAPKLYGKSGTALYKYNIGGEIKLGNDFTFLGGYEINKIISDNFLGLGVEYFMPQTRIEFGASYMQSTSKEDKTFSLAFKMYL